MTINHSWIDQGLDAEEMEAVLVATNDLPNWDASATMRAFQTYQWSNGSTSNDQASFAHDETGVIVCHDGNVVGIECGHGSLADALPDLILVLHSLGWRGAHVYCLAAHIHGVLADIGRSIPANLDFDVVEAKRGTPVAEMPEAQDVLDQGRAMLRTAADMGMAGNTAVSVFASLQEAAGAGMAPGPIALADDGEDTDLGDEVVCATLAGRGLAAAAPLKFPASSTPSLQPPKPMSIEEGDGAPRVFEFAGETLASSGSTPTARPSASQDIPHVATPIKAAAAAPTPVMSENMQAELVQTRQALDASRQRQAALELTLAQQERDRVRLEEEIVALQAECARYMAAAATPLVSNTRSEAGELFRVGRSAFYFVDPACGLSADVLATVAGELGVPSNQVVNLWPGAVQQPMRWDVLGEIDLEHPLFAETWAQWAFPGCESAVKVAETVLQLKASATPDLRELLVCDGAVQGALAALRLVRPGASFVDRHVPTTDEAPSEVREVFTVRETLFSQSNRLFVVRSDALDGAFVHWVVDLLRQVVKGYAMSEWCSRQIAAVLPEADVAAPAESKTLPSEVTAMVGELFGKLRELGINVDGSPTAS